MAKQLILLSYVKTPNLACNRDSKTAAGESDILYFYKLPEVYIIVNSAHIWFLKF